MRFPSGGGTWLVAHIIVLILCYRAEFRAFAVCMKVRADHARLCEDYIRTDVGLENGSATVGLVLRLDKVPSRRIVASFSP